MATKDFANGFVEDALRKGLTSAAAKNGASIPLSVHMSRAEQEKLVRLADALGLSIRSLMLAAIKLMAFRAQFMDATERKKLRRGAPAKNASLEVRTELSGEAIARLEQAGLTRDDAAVCALAGLKLLNERVIADVASHA